MTTTNAQIVVEIQGKVEAYRAALAQMPGITKDAADKSAKALEKGLTQQAAKQLAGLSETAAQQTTKAWTEAGKKITQTIGGPIGSLGDAVLELVPKASAASAALGATAAAAVGIGAAAAGAIAVATGIYKLAEAADAAEERLTKAGLAALIPAESRRSIDEYRDASERLSTATDLLTVKVGTGAVEAMTRASTVALGAVSSVDKLADSFNHLSESGGLLSTNTARVTAGIVTLGTSEALIRTVGAAYGYLADEGERAATAIDNAGNGAARSGDVDIWQRQAEAEEAARRKSADRAAAFLADREREERAAAKRIADAQVAEEKRADADRLHLYQYTGDLILREAEEARAEQERARTDAHEAEMARLRAQSGQIAENTRTAVEAATTVLEARMDALLEYATAEAEVTRRNEEARIRSEEQIRDATFSTIDTILSARIAALSEGNKEERKQARELVLAQRAIALFEVGVNTAVAISKGYSQLGPIGGAIATAGLVAMGVAQAAAIVAEPVPKFYRGGDVPSRGDGRGVQIEAHPGERVVSASTNDMLGPLLEAMDRGFAPLMGGMGGGAQAIVMDGRVVGRVLAKQVRGGGELGRAVRGGRPAGYVDPWGGR